MECIRASTGILVVVLLQARIPIAILVIVVVLGVPVCVLVLALFLHNSSLVALHLLHNLLKLVRLVFRPQQPACEKKGSKTKHNEGEQRVRARYRGKSLPVMVRRRVTSRRV